MPSDSLPIASFKLRFTDEHVRAVPSQDARGCAFSGPGVDLRGESAREVLALAAPLVAWLCAREPVTTRTLGIDRVKRRILVTVESTPRPRVLRIDEASDPASTAELLALAAPIEARIGELAAAAIARRGT